MPLSGDAAAFGTSIQQGMELALQTLEPSQKDKIEFLFEDDGLQPKNTISAFHRLVEQKKVQMLINFSSGTGNAISPLAEQKRIPLLVGIASDPKVVNGRNYSMLFWITPENEVGAMLNELKRRGLRRIGRVDAIQDGVLELKRVFDRDNKGLVEVVFSEEVSTELRDFKTIIAKLIKQPNLEGVMVTLMPGQISVFAKQLRQLDSKLPIFGFETFEEPSEIKAAGQAFEGVWFVNNKDAESGFAEKFRQRHPDSNATWAAVGYDLVRMTVAQFEKDSSVEAINQAFHNLRDFPGVMGNYSASADNRIGIPAAVKEITGGKVNSL